jgi:hypothetical protein
MQPQAYFSDVEAVIVRHLSSAKLCVHIYLDFFSNRDLFDLMVMRQRRGVQVNLALLDNRNNRQSSIAWERLTANGGEVFWLPEQALFDFDASQQFFIVDNTLVMSGNFNLGNPAVPKESEDLLIQTDSIAVDYFKAIFQLMSGENSVESPVTGVTSALVENPKIQRQRTQAQSLQVRIISIESEIAEIQRQINQFEHQKDQSIGDLIRRYLDVKRRFLHQAYRENIHADSKQQAEEAERVYQQYDEAHAAISADIKPVDLSVDQLDELKQLYRKLAMQCHPDRVEEEHKENAQVFFQQLQLNYKKNDLVSLKNLKIQIDSKWSFVVNDVVNEDSSRLAQVLTELQSSIARLTQQVSRLKQSAIWNELNAHVDWDALFSRHAEQLERELQRYTNKLEHAKHAD